MRHRVAQHIGKWASLLGGFCLLTGLVGYAQTPLPTDSTAAAPKNPPKLLLVSPNARADTVAVATQQDTIPKAKKTEKAPFTPNPAKAVRYSLLLPGLGQAYNRSYWKMGIVYGALGTTVGLTIFQHKQYSRFREAYIIRLDDNPETVDRYQGVYTTQSLRALRDNARQQRDQMIIFSVLVYALTAIEAYVDAHLKGFDVSDDLSLHLGPSLQLPVAALGTQTLPAAGVQLKLRLR